MVKEEQNKYIKLDPEISKIFQQSKSVSTSNGKAYHLFKTSTKRRRTKKLIEEDESNEAAKKIEIESKLKLFAEM